MDKLKPGIFLDRDNTINKEAEGGYVLKWKNFEFMPDAIEALKLLYSTGLPLFVVSNQSCIDKGLITGEDAQDIMMQMQINIMKHDIKLSGIMFCPHTKEECCSCKKPEPGMLYYTAIMNNICLKDSYMIGDSWTDIEAGERANISHKVYINQALKINEIYPEYVLNPDGVFQWPYESLPEHRKDTIECKSFLLAAQWVVENERRRNG
jgi:D-glycero-D-manno-heptose 1,7-bisphosphate phosphatase